VVLSLLLYPLHLQGLGYAVLGAGIEWMLWLAYAVAAMPYAALALYPLNDFGLALASFGLLVLCLLRSKIHVWGLALALLGVATAALYSPPDVLVSGDGRQVLARESGGGYTLLKGTTRAFAAEAWLRTVAGGEAVKLSQAEGVDCHEKWCEAHINGRRFVHVKQPEALYEACNGKPDVLYAWWYIDEEPCDEVSLLIDRNTLEQGGAVALWLGKAGVRAMSAVPAGIIRPWVPKGASEDE
jgi:competence protein ComEC